MKNHSFNSLQQKPRGLLDKVDIGFWVRLFSHETGKEYLTSLGVKVSRGTTIKQLKKLICEAIQADSFIDSDNKRRYRHIDDIGEITNLDEEIVYKDGAIVTSLTNTHPAQCITHMVVLKIHPKKALPPNIPIKPS